VGAAVPGLAAGGVTGIAHARDQMYSTDQEDTTIYDVVTNYEEQYSIWPAERETPAGWWRVGVSGTRAECLANIVEVWTDMRPKSLREAMERRQP
jgi:MbtH protein